MCLKLCCHVFCELVELFFFFLNKKAYVGWGVSNIKSPCKDNLPFYAFGGGVGGVLVGVCEHVTCESAAVEVKIRQDGSQDGLICFFCLRFHAPGTLFC